MRLRNCSLKNLKDHIFNRKIVFFGCGTWLQTVYGSDLKPLKSRFSYVVDNGNKKKTTTIGDITLDVYSPEKLREETDCVIILTSPIYMYDMYLQLQNMDLKENIDCYALPFMSLTTPNVINPALLSTVKNSEEKIPRVIHSFWFSGEDKPEEYSRCIKTWRKNLPGYEIIEWNCENYDYKKHPFVHQAINMKAWAFASDYARLDVLYEYGGIYLDMDVEVFKPFDDLLGNDALFSFPNSVLIDLAVTASRKNNPLFKRLQMLYDNVSMPKERKELTRFFQPAFIRSELMKSGIKMDGTLQVTKEATAFPREFFMPLDAVMYKPYKKTENTYCVHYDNFGWSYEGENKHTKKARDNNLLWTLIDNRI